MNNLSKDFGAIMASKNVHFKVAQRLLIKALWEINANYNKSANKAFADKDYIKFSAYCGAANELIKLVSMIREPEEYQLIPKKRTEKK